MRLYGKICEVGVTGEERRGNSTDARATKRVMVLASVHAETLRPLSDASLDVSFESSRYWTAIEVKSVASAKGDLERGFFQCVKYKAVMTAECAVQGKRKDVDALLVVEGKLSPDLLALANTLRIQFAEVSRHGTTYQCG